MSQHSFDWNKEVCGKSSAILTDSSGNQTVLFSERRHDSTYELLDKGSVVWLPKEEYGLCESALSSEIPVKYPRCGLAECPYCNREMAPSIDSHDLCLIKGSASAVAHHPREYSTTFGLERTGRVAPLLWEGFPVFPTGFASRIR